MYLLFKSIDCWSPAFLAWIGVIIIVVLEFHTLRNLLVHMFIKLYEFLIQQH
jgi:hypothetical protein